MRNLSYWLHNGADASTIIKNYEPEIRIMMTSNFIKNMDILRDKVVTTRKKHMCNACGRVLELEIENINRILNTETPCDDWVKGRHSALRGVRSSLEKILNGYVGEKSFCQCGYRSANDEYCKECGELIMAGK